MGPNAATGASFRLQTYGWMGSFPPSRRVFTFCLALLVHLLPPPVRFPNLIFDLGGVFINLDYAAPIAAFARLSGRDEPLAFNQKAQSPIFDAYEIGQLSDADFRQALRQRYVIADTVTDDVIDAAWNAILLDIPAARLELLRQLRAAGYRLFLLSNTNTLHRAAFDHILLRDHGLTNGLLGFFDQVYFSHEVGLRKPDPSIFERVVTDHQLVPSQTLFIDDSPQHVAAARTVGLEALWLEPGQEITAPSPLLDALHRST
jgi:glucose-1-phosphatase